MDRRLNLELKWELCLKWCPVWTVWCGEAEMGLLLHMGGKYSGKDTQRKSLDVVAEWKHGRLTLVKATFKPLLLDGAMNSCSFIKGYRSGLPSGCISTHVCGRLSVSRWAFSCSFFVLLAICLLMDSFPSDKLPIFFCLFCFVLAAWIFAALSVWAVQEVRCYQVQIVRVNLKTVCIVLVDIWRCTFVQVGRCVGVFFSPVFPSNYLFFFFHQQKNFRLKKLSTVPPRESDPRWTFCWISCTWINTFGWMRKCL